MAFLVFSRKDNALREKQHVTSAVKHFNTLKKDTDKNASAVVKRCKNNNGFCSWPRTDGTRSIEKTENKSAKFLFCGLCNKVNYNPKSKSKKSSSAHFKCRKEI